MDGALVASSSSSSTAPTIGRWTYDVFLSFRGEDTRKNFVGHLYAALDQAGIYTFKDDEKLQRGKYISTELVKAIEESMVSVVVFSKNYANSSWCLEELVKIMECWDIKGQRVLPVFYDVDPSVVRGQKRSFETAFQQHEVKFKDDLEKVKRWREALKTAANLSGWDVIAIGHEAECVKKLVRTILKYPRYHLEENLIGMESRVQHVRTLLRIGAGDVCFIGIWGMGGIGKTTIARAVYHQISYAFDGSCFLEDVRENGSDKKGLKSLQEKLLSEIMEVDFKLKDCDDGISQIQRRLSHKRVLVVLDDVDDIMQLEFLARSSDWFFRGSRIMITTRDKHMLCNTQEKYAPDLLNEREAMKLFSRYAFKADIPPKEYEKLSGGVVSHTGHLPLALKVLGSHFCGRSLNFWQSGLNALAKIPDKKINKALKLSFDGLNTFEQKIFLHIACFFKGKKRHYITRILDCLGLEAASGITILIEKSILTTSNGYLHMHDLIQEMGRCIVRECYSNNLVWCPEEIKEVMTTITNLETVEAIVETHDDYEHNCSAEVFRSMKKLRLLQVRSRFTSSEPTYLPEQLKWLCWIFYPFDSLTITRDMSKLVFLEMMYSWIKNLHIETQVNLTNLKFINLRQSIDIRSFPDISVVPNLEYLNLSHCTYLKNMHQSVWLHEKIIHLDLSFCPRLIFHVHMKMKSLQRLHLNSCDRLLGFPEVLGEMGKLLVLDINKCNHLTELPLSIRLFTGLTTLSMGLTGGPLLRITSITGQRIQVCERLGSMRTLNLKNNNLALDAIPIDLHIVWPFLEELDLSENIFTCLPASISLLSHLKYLNLSDCPRLKELPELPSLIQVLKADRCKSLQKIGGLSNKYKWLFKLSLSYCPKLLMDQESHLDNYLMKSLVQECAAVNHRLSITVPGSKIPNWFSNQRLGNTIMVKLPRNHITEMTGLALCCRLLPPPSDKMTFLKIKFKVSSEEHLIGRAATRAAESNDIVWTGYLSIDILGSICHGFEYENLMINFEDNVVECAACIIYKDDIKPMTGSGSWIRDYDELSKIDHESTSSEDWHHGRWSKPTFYFDSTKNGDHKAVEVWGVEK